MAHRCRGRKELKAPDKDENCVSAREPFLPQEIVVEILNWMPVKYLLRMKCVCKQWNDLIQDRYFIQKHISLANSCYVYYFNRQKVEGNMDEEDDDKDKSKKETFHLVCGCDGMLLKRSNASQKCLIHNPTTRKILYLPDSDHDLSLSISFSFVPSIGEYKLVSIYEDTATGNEGCEVITVGVDESWRPLQLPNSHGPNQSRRKLSVASAGAAVHCFRVTEVVGEVFEEVVSLDLETECFTSTTLEPGLFSDWKKVWALNWNGRPALAETGREELKVLVIEDYKKKYKLAENKFGVSLGGAKKVMQGDDFVPLVAERGILWVWLRDKKMFGYDIKHGRVRRELSVPEGYHITDTMYIGRESLATLRGMQKQPSSWLV
ncbi:hypothetical protein VitviT2T_014863 [Vitis vinifera]|uniref:F-box domain-containing protein n=1 Tax=Vitis vinifera TaxID=29760 RepID=A0ABY9CMA1_VITVI|nr:putative F-box protein At3g52320 [Vitis vinifera]WJZ96150.1 hypothetical protein VitviT2T_014863 [Vitis vinifera]|eukprot:XP_010647408.1 PREDICTED: putative F-box protein At3g52320 isoform X1 [Vitis vinifera]